MKNKNWLPNGFIRLRRSSKGYTKSYGFPTDLVYNIDTGIIYYFFSEKNNKCLCPYYGKNGKPCTLKNGNIVEVD